MENNLKTFKAEVEKELLNNILPFWSNNMIDAENGGYYGKIDGKGIVHRSADKGSVLNARILWTFSSAFRIYRKPEFLHCATRAKDFIMEHFQDKKYDGIYWLLDNQGNRLDTKKQIYAQAFTLYALAEYYRATGDEIALKQAIIFFKIIEKYSLDKNLRGYFEAFNREWGEIGDLRLSAKDANEKKTMNTHLHVLEAYTNLYRVWKDEGLKTQLQTLIEIFADKIVNNNSWHLNMFFTENWEDKTDLVSYGHDIESSWLLYEASEVLGNHELTSRVKDICTKIANAASEGLQPDGSLIYERFFENNHLDTDRHWWVQSEAVVGFFNTYQITGDKSYLEKSVAAWNFIKKYIVDTTYGEWLWSVDEKMQPNRKDDKAGFWKCPYHNARMCFEIMERIK